MAEFKQYNLPEEAEGEQSNIVYIGDSSVVKEGSLKSPNYVKGQVGWSINSDGTAEFQGLVIGGVVQTSKGTFGGDGSDGALTVSANIDIDALTVNYVVKNYETLTINAGNTLGLTNPATNGTILHIKVQGDVTINGSINLQGDGAAGGTAGASGGGASSAGSNMDLRWSDTTNQFGGAVGVSVGAGGGGGGGAHKTVGTAGTVGGGGGSAGGAAGTVLSLFTSNVNPNIFKNIRAICGAGGGGGGGGQNNAGGAGGRGGGVFILECGGDLTFGSASTINVGGADGSAGGAAGNSGGGGGGAGSGGQSLILYNGTLTDSGVTVTVTGGTGGAGGNAIIEDGGAGGNGGNGDSIMAVNNAFA